MFCFASKPSIVRSNIFILVDVLSVLNTHAYSLPATLVAQISISVLIAFSRCPRGVVSSDGNYVRLCKFRSLGGSFVFVFADGIQETKIKALSLVTLISVGGRVADTA